MYDNCQLWIIDGQLISATYFRILKVLEIFSQYLHTHVFILYKLWKIYPSSVHTTEEQELL